MKTLFLCFIFFFITFFANSQQVLDPSQIDILFSINSSDIVHGRISFPEASENITSGSVFFKDAWMKGAVLDAKGNSLGNVWLKLDLLNNEVNYKDKDGQRMIATTPLKYIVFKDSATNEKYEFVKGDQLKSADRTIAATWFRLLVNDKVSLCEQFKKFINRTDPFGTGAVEKNIVTEEYYFVQMNNKLIPFKRWNAWQILFKDRKEQLATFIKSNHLKGKSADEYVTLINYYNSLLGIVGKHKKITQS
ncbi:MAG: hypothetical protein JST96_00620 [Bacteroidetes bacterium]|nr:hypothetical protein [Bacteroidota bacterium]